MISGDRAPPQLRSRGPGRGGMIRSAGRIQLSPRLLNRWYKVTSVLCASGEHKRCDCSCCLACCSCRSWGRRPRRSAALAGRSSRRSPTSGTATPSRWVGCQSGFRGWLRRKATSRAAIKPPWRCAGWSLAESSGASSMASGPTIAVLGSADLLPRWRGHQRSHGSPWPGTELPKVQRWALCRGRTSSCCPRRDDPPGLPSAGVLPPALSSSSGQGCRGAKVGYLVRVLCRWSSRTGCQKSQHERDEGEDIIVRALRVTGARVRGRAPHRGRI